MMQKRRLGRGLAALIGDDDVPVVSPLTASGLKLVPLDVIRPSGANPRRKFEDADIESLAQSIKTKGILQPLIVRPVPSGDYEIVAGERRWRAAQRAQLHEVPVIVRDLDDREMLEIALIENIQRADLNPLEEAQGYKQLLEQYSYTQQQLAEGVGKSRSHIANTLRLLTLPQSVLKHIEAGLLTAGHARALVATDSPELVAEQIIKLGLSVRQAEELARNKNRPVPSPPVSRLKDADTKSLEVSLGKALGLGVSIDHAGDKGGKLTISYKTLDQLDDLVRKLTS